MRACVSVCTRVVFQAPLWPVGTLRLTIKSKDFVLGEHCDCLLDNNVVHGSCAALRFNFNTVPGCFGAKHAHRVGARPQQTSAEPAA